jgi:hypothetical protein
VHPGRLIVDVFQVRIEDMLHGRTSCCPSHDLREDA